MKRGASGAEALVSEDGKGRYALHAVQDNLENLSQLQREHRQRLQLIEEECSKLSKFRDDYLHLRKRLKTLPDKTFHEAMVPLGPLAFMPGRLIHTNEILVLLGDNWFAERSAKEAIEMVNRRIRDCDEKIKTAETTKNVHINWLKETSDLFEDGTGQIEIVEELTEEEFEMSKVEHRKKVAEHYDKKRKMFSREDQETETATESGESSSQETPEAFVSKLDEADKRAYESIMRRLDQLELEEDEDSDGSQSTDECDRDDIEYSEIQNEDFSAQGNTETAVSSEERDFEEQKDKEISVKEKKKLKRRVSWADDKRPLHTVIPDDDSKSIYRIKYTTRQLSLPLSECDGNSPEASEDNENTEAATAIIQSPSDIYKVFRGRRSSLQDPPPKGILKKTISNPESQSGAEGGWSCLSDSPGAFADSPDDQIPQSSSELPLPNDNESLEPAFSYKVLERNIDSSSGATSRRSSAAENQNKKVSRFKASRMKK